MRVRVERGEVSRRMFGKSTTGRRVCTRQAAAAEEPLKSKQTRRELYMYPRYRREPLWAILSHSAPNHFLLLLLLRGCGGKEVAGAGAERRK